MTSRCLTAWLLRHMVWWSYLAGAVLSGCIAMGTAGGAEPQKAWNFQGTRKPNEELKVTRVTRLTHPLVNAEMVSFWYSAHYAFNADGTRIAYLEAWNSKGIRERGVVWAKISDLKNWKTLEEYLASSHPQSP